MRFKSKAVDGFTVYAVAGVNTISFGIDATPGAREGLLGFTVDRIDVEENNQPVTMPGFKVFQSIIPKPQSNQWVSTYDHPVQSFVWDDFTAKSEDTRGRRYEYIFWPLRGTPYKLDRTAKPITIRVKTEPLHTKDDHDIFFNRGVASSQAYARKFGNLPPSKQETKAKQMAALEWLARDLDNAMLKFIASAGKQDTLLCCFYEFRYRPILNALATAHNNVRELKIIIDAKDNPKKGKEGKVEPPFPRVENLNAIKAAGLPASCIIQRDANHTDIQHNKFMVILRGTAKTPTDVWTGSTNISEGGITGQTNVGHWVHDRAVATAYKSYWDLLSTNPGAAKSDSAEAKKQKKAAYRRAVADLSKVPTALKDIPQGTTTVFSPRSGSAVLNLYVNLVDEADDLACITLAFGINENFKNKLKDNTSKNPIIFLLLEKKDTPRKDSKKAFIALNASHNIYKAWGAYIRDPVYQWARETNAKQLRLNNHVAYIHSKFLLRDPLGADPIVVTGSANFSAASTSGNDENMLIIRGNSRVADIYFTEFNRLFNHYYFRAVAESNGQTSNQASRFLAEKHKDWLQKYAPGTLKSKRLTLYTSMNGFAPG